MTRAIRSMLLEEKPEIYPISVADDHRMLEIGLLLDCGGHARARLLGMDQQLTLPVAEGEPLVVAVRNFSPPRSQAARLVTNPLTRRPHRPYYRMGTNGLMSRLATDDSRLMRSSPDGGGAPAAPPPKARGKPMTAFVESCIETVTGSARQAERRHRHKPRARQLLRVLAGRKNILITTHRHPDPDALASSLALCQLLRLQLRDAAITPAIAGTMGGGLNAAFAQSGGIEELKKLDTLDLASFDAIVLLDAQPHFTNSPLPAGVMPAVVIDHHRSLGKRPKCGLCDVRAEVGATSSIIFSYFMELEAPISRELGAMLLYAIESDLAGAAGTPGELDNLALSSLTLIADPRKLYRMRYVDLPQSYYIAYARGLENAIVYDSAVLTHLDTIDSPEKPAVLADFLLRYDPVQWALATGVSPERRLVLSMRTSSTRLSAADVIRKLVRHLGEGGGHRTKAGGSIPLETGSDAEIQRLREVLKRRLLRAIGIKNAKPQRLVPRS